MSVHSGSKEAQSASKDAQSDPIARRGPWRIWRLPNDRLAIGHRAHGLFGCTAMGLEEHTFGLEELVQLAEAIQAANGVPL